MNRYASFLQNMGDCARAESQLEQILEVRLERRMDNSDATRGIVSRLALVTEKRGDFEKASKILQLVVQQNLRSLGGNHTFTVGSMYNLARTLNRRGEFQAAENLLLWVVPRLRERADFTRGIKKPGWKVFNRAMRRKTKTNGIDNLNDAEKLLMRVKYRQGKIDGAKNFASEAHTYWNSLYGPLHKYTFAIEAIMDEIEEARKLLSHGENLREVLSECESISGYKIDRDRLATFGSIGSKMVLDALDAETIEEKLPALAY
jgi:tetratricopeptide (TPR) repeat protein